MRCKIFSNDCLYTLVVRYRTSRHLTLMGLFPTLKISFSTNTIALQIQSGQQQIVVKSMNSEARRGLNPSLTIY